VTYQIPVVLMSHRFTTPITTSGAAGITVAAVAVSLLGCVHASRPVVDAPAALTLTAAGTHFSTVASDARGVVEVQTVSVALDRIDQRELPLDRTYRHQGTGRGVVVYVFDGGVMSTHPELAGRVRKGYDAFDNDPAICNSHGTAVAGAVAGRTLGVAPEAEIVDVKMVECGKLRGTIKAIVDGTKWVIEDQKTHGRPSVANWSFIADTASRIPQLDSAVARLRAAGIPVIVSAGNLEINACRVSPGNADGTIVVGASSIARTPGSSRVVDRRSYNTAYGPCVDVYAPGDSVLLPSFDATRAPSVQLWNGTSMSTGYVSGAAALYLEANPLAHPDDVSRHIRETATRNVVQDAGTPLSRMLYVGPAREELKSVAEIRAQMARR
jgi:subtilisin family serine protease